MTPIRQFHNMSQRSPEWFRARANVVSASEAGIILGHSGFKTRDQLLAEKLDPALKKAARIASDNAATRWGKAHEEEALFRYLADHPHYVYEHLGFAVVDGWIGASPDGLINDDGLIEIKCPYSNRPLKPSYEQPWYLAQVQVQLYCTGRQWCDFYQWRPNQIAIERILPDPGWQADNLPKLKAFHVEWMQATKVQA